MSRRTDFDPQIYLQKAQGQKLTPNAVKEMKEAFDLLDEDRSGFIDIRELRAAVVSLGLHVDPAQLTEIVQSVAGPDGHTISFDEFFELMTRRISPDDKLDEIMKIFMLFDRDRTGTISVKNLKEVATQLGEDVDDSQLEEMMDLLDSDGDREISPEDFYYIITRGAEARRLREVQEQAEAARGNSPGRI
uniref:EF-hand domain-containing protein n=1 Tax=Chromera velia CCMP2878 TaxID=1169474 RepID=A0A0G4H3J0_9ALVE|mmetsp:Transcript_4693/g.9426  ORF Transcript_4693/g.9426 Transcript_4693/m.9426 type:complete len:190 (+) Transcript_4693:186-755(+)|eukprot:Cvel_5646.t1-p1 / transcript=Cvel_5646.t1 / gene=Cvel_5646 / organism=Chromera_velia_CCMP2878 / gene_product=Caltractin ICL1d, putative / transcript_product=Caltractin ICL1d, putative / location=Cvel_scaffold266:79880-83877(-) / protein_length=189 / sequence_SO=supercontig / SO=protein_coding / is_pseudo=false